MSFISFVICAYLGVGKSETAYRAAETMLSRKTRASYGRRPLPTGLLVLRGEDYSTSALRSRTTAGTAPVEPSATADMDTGGIGIAEVSYHIIIDYVTYLQLYHN